MKIDGRMNQIMKDERLSNIVNELRSERMNE